MLEIGRLVMKIAGRDAGCKAVIIDILDDKYVLLDGETRRRKSNVLHIEPLNQKLDIKKKAPHDEVAKALKELGIEARETKPRPKTQKPIRKRKTSEQLKAQKEEKKKFRDIFKPKKKEEKAEAKETTLEEKAGLGEEKAGLEVKEANPAEKKESKPKAEKPKKSPKKEEKE